MTRLEGEPGGATVSVTRAVAAFLVAGLVVLTATGAVLAVLQRRQAVTEAVRDARSLTSVMAHAVVGPVLSDAALVPGADGGSLDQLVKERVLGNWIVRVKIWDAKGRIVYSDDASLIGRVFPLPDEERRALTQEGPALAEVSNLSEPENVGEQQFGKLLQVYLGVRTKEGTPLLFETYQAYDTIRASSRAMWLDSLPVLIGALGLLYLVQIPLAYRMAVRLRSVQEQREQLLLSALAASDRERRRIAADLHDGVLQGLSGASYSLSAAAGGVRAAGDNDAANSVERTALDLRRWVRELRTLVVTITPPALHQQGLAASLADLASTMEVRGVEASIDVTAGEGLALDEATEALVYRVAQEAVRNVVRHADAGRAILALEVDRPAGRLRLTVTDDGRGYDVAQAGARARGSVGLELLRALVAERGGSLTSTSSAGTGTTLALSVPLTAAQSLSGRHRVPV